MKTRKVAAPAVQALLADRRYGLVRRASASGALAWVVQIRRQGKRYGHSFAAGKHGGERAAYRAARAWRDALLLKLGPAGSTAPCWQPPAGYAAGVSGVRVHMDRGRAYLIAATALPNGKVLSKMFSVDKYGEPEARRLAIAAREQHLQARAAYREQHPPTPRQSRTGSDWYLAPAMYGIYRVSSPRARAGQDIGSWRVQIKRDGVNVCDRLFADRNYGGKAAALAEAKAWRDRMARKHKPMLKVEQNQRLRRNNTSGVVGVCRSRIGDYEYYVAQTVLPGKYLSKAFSISKYGERQARALAIAAREQQLQQVSGYGLRNPGALPPDPTNMAKLRKRKGGSYPTAESDFQSDSYRRPKVRTHTKFRIP